jgi:isopenicillin-N N-acyltransferase-like protein
MARRHRVIYLLDYVTAPGHFLSCEIFRRYNGGHSWWIEPMSRSYPVKKFRHLYLHGHPAEVGYQHGSSLSGEIREVLDYYRGLFGLAESELRRQGAHYGEIIRKFDAGFATEIEAIARSAGLDTRLIYALNSRSEIFNNVMLAECTAVINSGEALLAQNWDWAEVFEPLVVDMSIERPDGHRIRMLTEPGIIGKIGMNSAGLGVCLNILTSAHRIEGLPVHVLLRAILECRSLGEVEAIVDRHSTGKASHILVGDASGGCLSIEFSGGVSLRLKPESGLLCHTNHYLANPSLNSTILFPSTEERMRRAMQLLNKDASREGIRHMLLDRSMAEMSICRPYSPADIQGFGNVGTVFSLVMDLTSGKMDIRAGSQGDTNFYRVAV